MESVGFLPKADRKETTHFVLEAIRGKKVLHVGCAGGLLSDAAVRQYASSLVPKTGLHARMLDVACELAGLDVSEEKLAAMAAAGVGGKLIVGDIAAPHPPQEAGANYDVVVLADVIEHLDNVGNALRNCAQLMSNEGVLIVTTNNAFYIGALLKLLARYESVHPEHTCYFTYRTMHRMLDVCGYEIAEFYWGKHERTTFTTWADQIVYSVAGLVSGVVPQFSSDMVFLCKRVRDV